MLRSSVVAGVLLALGLSSTAAGGMSYQHEPEVEFFKLDAEFYEFSTLTFGYKYFLEPVDNNEAPYWLQPFRQRSSWVSAGYGFGKWEAGTSDVDVGNFRVEGRYVIPEMPLGIDASYTKMSVDDADYEESEFGLGVVYWLGDDNNLAVEGGFVFGDLDIGVDETTSVGLEVGARYIVPIQDYQLEIAASYTSKDYDENVWEDEDGLAVEARFFFTKEVFAGASFSTATDDDTWDISGGYSNDSGLRVEGGVGKYDGDDVAGFGVGYRF